MPGEAIVLLLAGVVVVVGGVAWLVYKGIKWLDKN